MKQVKYLTLAFLCFLLCGCNSQSNSSKKRVSEEEFFAKTQSINAAMLYSSAKMESSITMTSSGRKEMSTNKSLFLYENGTYSVFERTENSESVKQLEDFINYRLPFVEGYSITSNSNLPSDAKYEFFVSGKNYSIDISFDTSGTDSGYNINGRLKYEILWNEFGYLTRVKMSSKGSLKGFDEYLTVEYLIIANFSYYL